jgi:hypothetical protein
MRNPSFMLFSKLLSRTLACSGMIASFLLPSKAARATTSWYASPDGSRAGSGSTGSPWDIATALAGGNGAVRPGDTIYLRGGTYKICTTVHPEPSNPYCLASTVAGSSNAPVGIRSAPGEWAVLDGGGPVLSSQGAFIFVKGNYVSFQNFEVMSSNPTTRRTFQTGSFVSDVDGWAFDITASHIKIANLIIHDLGGGIGCFNNYDDIDIYGNVIYYIGWQGPDRGHGHAIYVHTATHVRIINNILFDQFDIGLHLYGGALPNYDVEGNTAFYNGMLSYSGATIDILLGDASGNVATSPIFLNNRTYSPILQRADTVNIGFSSGCTNLTHNNNYYVGPTALVLVNCTVSSMTRNTFYGATSGFSPSSYFESTYYATRPSRLQVFVQPNSYEAGRAYITVYNWEGQPSVSANVPSVLTPGDTYEVLDAQHYHGAPIAGGTYSGGAISIPVPGSSASVEPLVGNGVVAPIHTPNEFGAFILIKQP